MYTRAAIRLLPILLLLATVSSAQAKDEEARTSARPNVVLIVADDLGYADVGFQGSKDIPTPHIDTIASGGVRFTNGYVSAPVCSPTRAGLLTGRYQQRFGHEFNTGGNRKDTGDIGLPTTERTIADVMKAAGYCTGMVGKWHLGAAAKFHPQARGFDDFYGFLGGARSYFTWTGGAAAPVLRGREAVDEEEYLTDAFGREAVSFIDANKEHPFFLYLPFNAVHTPMHATPKYVDRFENITNAKRKTYAGMTSAMDDAVGAVLAALERHGLEDRTLVIFFSDNGGPERVNASDNGPLRAGKGTMYEGGIRVPFAMRWPGTLPAGTVYEHPVISLDVLPTVAAAVGARLPEAPTLDGVDLLPYVKKSADGVPHDVLCWRMGTRHAIRHGSLKLVVEREGKPELFDLASDLGETENLASTMPKQRADLERLYAAWEQGTVAPRWIKPPRNRRNRR